MKIWPKENFKILSNALLKDNPDHNSKCSSMTISQYLLVHTFVKYPFRVWILEEKKAAGEEILV